MITVAIGVSAVGVTSWTAPIDLIFLGAQAGVKACDVVISTLPGFPASATTVEASPAIYYHLGTNANGRVNVKIPVPAGEKLFIGFSALGDIVMYFDLPAS